MGQTEDMKELIRREIQSIPNLAERVAYKDIMEGVFLALYEKNEEMYRNLETRVMDDLAYNINQYQIRTGIVEKRYLDLSHHLMTQVCREDVETVQCRIGELRKEIQETGKARLSTVFLQGDVLEIAQMIKAGRTYPGILRTEKGYNVSVRLEPGVRYCSGQAFL